MPGPPRQKIVVTGKPPVGGISVVTLIRTDTTLDHSQKAEKVCTLLDVSRASHILITHIVGKNIFTIFIPRLPIICVISSC